LRLDPKDPITLLIPLIGIALILLAVWLAGGTRRTRLDRALVLRRLAEDLPGFAAAEIVIVWDRLFGTFVDETASDPCRYGIVRNIGSFNPLRIALHEWVAILRDLRAARSGRERVVYLLGAPGRSLDGSRLTTDQLRAAWLAQAKRLAWRP